MTRAPLRADRSAMITGIGAVTPLGNDFDTIAAALLDGRSGVVEIDGAGFSREARQFAAPVAAIPAMAADDSLDRLGRLCLAAAHAARARIRPVPMVSHHPENGPPRSDDGAPPISDSLLRFPR